MRFIKIRNKSELSSNLQFSIDAAECKFKPDELGKPEKKMVPPGLVVWVWENTPHGCLIEAEGQLTLYKDWQTFLNTVA